MSISPMPHQPSIPLTPTPSPTGPHTPSQVKRHEHESHHHHDKPLDTDKTPEKSTAPPSADALAKMNQLGRLLNRDNLIQMMRAPYSAETRQSVKALRQLVSKETINTLTRDPKERADLRAKLGELFSEKNIHILQREASALPIAELTPERIAQRTADADPEKSYEATQKIQSELDDEKLNTRNRKRQCQPLCEKLIAIGQSLGTQAPEATPGSKPEADVTPHHNSTVHHHHNHAQVQSDTPLSPEALTTMRDLADILSRNSLIRMMHEPHTTYNAQRRKRLDELLSEDSLNSLSSDLKEVKKLRALIDLILSLENLQSLLYEAFRNDAVT